MKLIALIFNPLNFRNVIYFQLLKLILDFCFTVLVNYCDSIIVSQIEIGITFWYLIYSPRGNDLTYSLLLVTITCTCVSILHNKFLAPLPGTVFTNIKKVILFLIWLPFFLTILILVFCCTL